MKIILKEDIVNLGFKNDVVEVKNGYGRNYLIPQGKAILATPSALKIHAENLRQQAHKLAKRLQQECAEFARLSQNGTYWNLSHRACVIAWLKACVLYVANGLQWEKAIEDFVAWSLRYDLWCKMAFFGADIEKAEQGDDNRLNARGPRNLLEMLPDEFSFDDARRIRQQEGLSTDDRKCRNMLYQWVYRKYILQLTDYSFKKVKKD